MTQFRENFTLHRKEGSGRNKDKRKDRKYGPYNIHSTFGSTSGIIIWDWQTILKKDFSLFPYRLTCVQELKEADFPLRAEYCQWFLNTFDKGLLQNFFLLMRPGCV